MHHPTDRIAHTTAFVTPVVEHWLHPQRSCNTLTILVKQLDIYTPLSLLHCSQSKAQWQDFCQWLQQNPFLPLKKRYSIAVFQTLY